MKRLFASALAALLALSASAYAGHLCCNVHCIEPPPPSCPDCGCPCDHGLHLCLGSGAHAQKLIDELCHAECCCDRIKAAHKLGSRLHADFCCCPEVLNTLVGALQCDTCWEVRRAAAWGIAMQNARTDQGVLALYVASKMDPHYLVRDRAAEALSILILCRGDCYKDLFKGGDDLIKYLKKNGYKPGSDTCHVLFADGCASCGLGHGTVVAHDTPTMLPPAPPPAPEKIKVMPSSKE